MVGCLSAWSGTGGPVVLLPLLALLGVPATLGVDAAQRVQLPVALAATAVNFAAGRLDILLGLGIGVLVLAGWAVGRWLARRLPVPRLRQAVALALDRHRPGLSLNGRNRHASRDETSGTGRARTAAGAANGRCCPKGRLAGLGVVVRDGRFADIGPLAEVAARHPQLTPLALPQRLLMPGFVDAHHHLTQSFGKALAFGEPSEIFRRIWVPLEGSLDAHGLYLSAKLAALEALRGGFTTVCDAGARNSAGLQAIEQAAARSRHPLRAGNDLPRRRPRVWPAPTASWRAAVPLLHPALAVAIPEAADDALLHAASRLAAEAGAVFQVHVNEHLASVERSLVARGQRPLQHLHAAGALGPQALLAHCTMLTPDEMLLLRDSGSAVAINPVASPWKGNAVAPSELLATLGVRLGLGTDGTRSDGFRMMDAAESNQRLAFGLASGDSVCGGGRLWLDMPRAAAPMPRAWAR